MTTAEHKMINETLRFRFYMTKCGGILQVHCFEEKHLEEIEKWSAKDPHFEQWITEWSEITATLPEEEPDCSKQQQQMPPPPPPTTNTMNPASPLNPFGPLMTPPTPIDPAFIEED